MSNRRDGRSSPKTVGGGVAAGSTSRLLNYCPLPAPVLPRRIWRRFPVSKQPPRRQTKRLIIRTIRIALDRCAAVSSYRNQDGLARCHELAYAVIDREEFGAGKDLQAAGLHHLSRCREPLPDSWRQAVYREM